MAYEIRTGTTPTSSVLLDRANELKSTAALGVRPRLDAISYLRGIVIALMVLDNAWDFVGKSSVNPRDVHEPLLFLTRWISHSCAPVLRVRRGLSQCPRCGASLRVPAVITDPRALAARCAYTASRSRVHNRTSPRNRFLESTSGSHPRRTRLRPTSPARGAGSAFYNRRGHILTADAGRRTTLGKKDASFIGVELQGGVLAGIDFTNAKLLAHSTPAWGYLDRMKGLASVELVGENRHVLFVSLRSSLIDHGLRQLERESTYAIERAKTSYAPQPERFLKWLFFEEAACYGLCYERPLIIILILMILFAVIYVFPISWNSRGSNSGPGVFKVWSPEAILSTGALRVDENQKMVERLSAKAPARLWYAFYFSLLSAFHFGWLDLNVGNWIARLQGQQYALRPTGWVRTISGLQSLISIYLVALWVLTYFARPFQ